MTSFFKDFNCLRRKTKNTYFWIFCNCTVTLILKCLALSINCSQSFGLTMNCTSSYNLHGRFQNIIWRYFCCSKFWRNFNWSWSLGTATHREKLSYRRLWHSRKFATNIKITARNFAFILSNGFDFRTAQRKKSRKNHIHRE